MNLMKLSEYEHVLHKISYPKIPRTAFQKQAMRYSRYKEMGSIYLIFKGHWLHQSSFMGFKARVENAHFHPSTFQ